MLEDMAHIAAASRNLASQAGTSWQLSVQKEQGLALTKALRTRIWKQQGRGGFAPSAPQLKFTMGATQGSSSASAKRSFNSGSSAAAGKPSEAGKGSHASSSTPHTPGRSSTMEASVTSFALVERTLSNTHASGMNVKEEEEWLEVAGGTTFSEAMLNAVNILLGVGLLSIPYALREGGWLALGVLGLLGGVTNYTGKLLGKCQERMCLLSSRPPEGSSMRRGLMSYEEIGEAAFGKLGRDIITLVLYTELVGTCGLFFILEGDNLALLLGGDPKKYMYAAAFALLPSTWLPDLSALAGLGLLGALASVSVLGLVLYTFLFEGFPVGAGHELVHLSTFPLTFGVLAFVYAGHAVFPNIQASMEKPSDYPKMINLTYIIVGLVSALVGIIGYQMYGSSVKEEIILNFRPGLLATVATGLIVINPFTKFALTMDPVARGLEAALGLRNTEKESSKGLFLPLPQVAARTALGALALFLATSVPFFGSVMALIGSCLTIAVSVVLPSLAYLQLFGDKLENGERYWNYFVVGLGIACAVAGTYSALESIQTGHAQII